MSHSLQKKRCSQILLTCQSGIVSICLAPVENPCYLSKRIVSITSQCFQFSVLDALNFISDFSDDKIKRSAVLDGFDEHIQATRVFGDQIEQFSSTSSPGALAVDLLRVLSCQDLFGTQEVIMTFSDELFNQVRT